MTNRSRTWGDDVFGGFAPLTKEEDARKRDEKVMREVGYILSNHKITPRRLVLIIEAETKPKQKVVK
jgi:hypothetical protein